MDNPQRIISFAFETEREASRFMNLLNNSEEIYTPIAKGITWHIDANNLYEVHIEVSE